MGIIGLYDADAEKYIHTVFNLELMKLSAYFKKKRDIVTMVPSFCPEKYTTFYYRKDYNDNDFPRNLTKIPNLVYGGLAFSNNNYIPLDNNIEKMIPDISIYQPTKIRFCSSSEKEEYYNRQFGEEIAGVADYAVLIGEKKTKPIYEGLLRQGFDKDKIIVFNDVREAYAFINSIYNGKENIYALFENDLPDTYNE